MLPATGLKPSTESNYRGPLVPPQISFLLYLDCSSSHLFCSDSVKLPAIISSCKAIMSSKQAVRLCSMSPMVLGGVSSSVFMTILRFSKTGSLCGQWLWLLPFHSYNKVCRVTKWKCKLIQFDVNVVSEQIICFEHILWSIPGCWQW